jgi:hypothetical protein
VLREQPSCLAIDLTPSPLRAITRISTASSWVNIDGTEKAVILAQVGHFYFGAVGQYYIGANIQHGGSVEECAFEMLLDDERYAVASKVFLR